MRTKNILILAFCITSLCGCSVGKHTSEFSIHQVELGVNKQEFTAKYGKPFNQEASYNKGGQLEEKLFYKEKLHRASWYTVTTAFIFQDSKLIEQKIVKEERMYQECNCHDAD